MKEQPSVINLYNAEFSNLINEEDVQLVDVRTYEEYRHESIPGALHIDVTTSYFFVKIEELDQSKPVAVYCENGQKSFMAAQILVSKGFKAYNLQNGFVYWNGKRVSME